MSIKSLFITFLFLLFFQFLYSQSNWTESIHLKNGTVVSGMIIEQTPNVSLKIKTKDGSTFVFKFDEIEKITKEPAKKSAPVAPDTVRPVTYYPTPIPTPTRFQFAKSGVWFNPRFGFIVPAGISLNVVGGYQASKAWAIGIGTGIDQYIDFNNHLSATDDNSSSSTTRDAQTPVMAPIFLENRFYFGTSRASLYVLFDLGYTILLQSNRAYNQNSYNYNSSSSYYRTITSGGAMISLGMGVRMAVNTKIAFTGEFTWLFQSYSSKDEFTNSTTHIDYHYGTALYPTLKFGILF